ncbi:hypothetical protein NDU88_001591 [Pleurodeles waltl]|uniref:Uncharacterized protein n=1 Tax=Pleurodeles waltl TaxID=8319 RepID=A0AAV7VX95_PLEWA|nr:hypothetical protein NDU88_001591 [Pleurodeles waltl]
MFSSRPERMASARRCREAAQAQPLSTAAITQAPGINSPVMGEPSEVLICLEEQPRSSRGRAASGSPLTRQPKPPWMYGSLCAPSRARDKAWLSHIRRTLK